MAEPKRISGWITGRSRIAFLVGLALAMGAIIALEAIDFSRGADPFGSYWLNRRGFIQRIPEAPASQPNSAQIAALEKALANGGDGVSVLLAQAACLHGQLSCSTSGASMDSPRGWKQSLDGALALAAAQRLVMANVDTPELRSIVIEAAAALARLDRFDMAEGHRQFAARAAGLVGREFPQDRSYVLLRESFMDDGRVLTPKGGSDQELAEGLALQLAVFGDDGIARRLSHRLFLDRVDNLASLPTGLLLLWQGQFADERLDAAIATRWVEGEGWRNAKGQSIETRQAAFGLLAAASRRHGPLFRYRN